MSNTIALMEIKQPIGSFYFGKMFAQDLIDIKMVKRVHEGEGVQRLLKPDRVKAVSLFCEDPDATFPTPIILSVNSADMQLMSMNEFGVSIFSYDSPKPIAEILDGQHRVEGIEKSNLRDVELPVVVMFDLTEEQKAYIFSTINGTQERVNPSVIYELFKLSKNRSPLKTCHEIARALNSDMKSPFFRRLKMLEKREYKSETISQNTFVKSLCKMITLNPNEAAIDLKKGKDFQANDNLAFSYYFKEQQDAVILKILLNYFNAVNTVFHDEWNNHHEYILSKTIGFSALMEALNKLIPLGEEKGTLNYAFFESILLRFRDLLDQRGLRLTSEDFSSSGADRSRLSNLILEVANN